MNPKGKEILLGVIAILLLAIYSMTLGKIILSVSSWDPNEGPFVANGNVIWVIELVGGLVAAVVISNLAVSNPGATPLSQVRTIATEYGEKLLQTVVWIYIIIWLIIGTAAFYVGVIKCPDVSEALTEIGKAWLGVLAGSIYAWFGITKT
jgi:hypothetical protein